MKMLSPLTLRNEYYIFLSDESSRHALIKDVKTYLCEVWCTFLVIYQINQVRFRPERSKPRFLKHLPPTKERLETLVPKMNFHGELTKWQWLAGFNIGSKKIRHSFKLPTLDINFEEVDMGMAYEAFQTPSQVRLLLTFSKRTVHFHQGFKSVHLPFGFLIIFVETGETIRREMRSMSQVPGNLGAERLHSRVIAPNLAVLSVVQNFSLKGRFVVDACKK